jgi:hypothetical protein
MPPPRGGMDRVSTRGKHVPTATRAAEGGCTTRHMSMPSPEDLVASLSHVQLRDAFCSYCGRQPSVREQGASRVCVRCRLGMVLRAPRGGAPKARDPFLIVDEHLVVRAISQRAEIALGIQEPEGVDALLDKFLKPAGPGMDCLDLALFVQLAVAGDPPADTLEFRGRDGSQAFGARLTSCGQPPAALLILAPIAEPVRGARTNGSSTDTAHHEKALARA